MSFHHPASDISRINREAFRRKVKVDPWTWRVLRAAQKLSQETDGLFDITVARKLMQWNYLPRRYRNVSEGNWRDIVLEKNCTVRFRQRVIVDLGGIAKGFAVDRAVEALKRAGVPSGVVNAGGDLRVFGLKSELVHLRRPDEPMRPTGAIKLRERALATSGIYFAQKRCGRAVVSSLLNGRTCRSSRNLISVSVAASACMTADALTKIVFILREKSRPCSPDIMPTHCCLSAMVRHYGCFAHHATPATGLDSIEAPAEIFSLRRVGAGFFERSGMGVLELFCGVAWRF